MAITFNTQEAKLEKKATTYQNFTYDTESNGGCLSKFVELSKIIETVAQDVIELGNKYDALLSKYEKFTDFGTRINSNKTSLLTSINDVRKAYDNIIKNLDDQVEYFCKNDTSFINDLESINKMISNNGNGSTGGGSTSGGGGSYGGGALTSGGGSTGNTGIPTGSTANYESITPAGNPNAGAYVNPSGGSYSSNYSDNASQNNGNYKDVQEEVSANYTDFGGGSNLFSNDETGKLIKDDVIPIEMPTGTNFPSPVIDPEKFRKGDTGFNGFAGVSPDQAFKDNVTVTPTNDFSINDLPVGGMKIPEITTINPDGLSGEITSNIVGGTVEANPGLKAVSLNDIIEGRSIVGGTAGDPITSHAELTGVSLNDIIKDANSNTAVRLTGDRVTGDAYIDIK